MNTGHKPVLSNEVIDLLKLEPGMTVLDATVGCGGHSVKILERIGEEGILIGLDRDKEALVEARAVLKGVNTRLRHRNFTEIKQVLEEENIEVVDALLFDLGVSSLQLDRAERGFSFKLAGPLDMRMDRGKPLTAAAMLKDLSPDELARIFREYGEEKLGRRIAREIARRGGPDDTKGLAELIRDVYARAGVKHQRIDPATRVFQALRIAVNDELNNIARAIPQALEVTRAGGRMAVISFHSLEDRIVKEAFARAARGCICPAGFPVCCCGVRRTVKVVTRKPVCPTELETEDNPRSRSARLRVAEKV